jgi:hypothetical protein
MDARLPDRWLTDRRVQRLSATHYRALMNSLMYMVANRTDGSITAEDFAMIPHFAADAPDAFVRAGLWEPTEQGWVFVGWASTQTTRSEAEALERVRAREREKKARQRATASSPRDTQQDSPRDMSPGPSGGNYRQGQARQGKARPGEEAEPKAHEPQDPWGVVAVPERADEQCATCGQLAARGRRHCIPCQKTNDRVATGYES